MGKNVACVLGLILVLAIPASAADPPQMPGGAASPTGRTLDFRVVERDDGKPVAGAAILARSGGWKGPTTRGTTDAQGYCSVPVPPASRTSREFAVHAFKDGFVPIKVLWGYNREFEFEGVPASYTLILDRGTPIGGIVRDDQGRPVAGARVYPYISGNRGEIESIELPGDASFATDDEGRWRCVILPTTYAADRMPLTIRHPGFITSTQWADRAVPLELLRALSAATVLQPGYSVSGAVTDADGRPIGGATVAWLDSYTFTDGPAMPAVFDWAAAGLDRGDGEGVPGLLRVKTGPDGRFRLENRPPGTHLVTAEAPGLAPAARFVRLGPPEAGPPRPLPPAMPGGPAVEYQEPPVGATQLARDGPCEPPLVFRLAPGRTIVGRVVDGRGRPVAGVTIAPAGSTTMAPQGWKTGPDGRFRCTNVPGEATALNVINRAEKQSTRHEIGPGAPGTEVVITTPTPFRLSGKVIDAETGRPIERFRLIKGSVYLRASFPGNTDLEEDSPPDWSHEPAETVVGGRYETGFVDAADAPLGYPLLRVRIEAEGYSPADSRRYQDDEGEQTCDFALHKHPWIKGTVRAPDGSPVAGAEVVVAVKGRPAPRIDNGRLASGWTGDVVRTGPDGRYAFAKPDAPGRVVIVGGRGLAQRTIDELASEPDVSLEPWGRIRGQVRVGAGVGARRLVGVFGAEPDHRGEPEVSFFGRTLTDAEGRFELDRVAPGYAMVYRPQWFTDGTRVTSHRQGVEAASGQTAEVIVGGAGRPVVGRLTRADGLPAFDLMDVRGRLRRMQPSPEFPEGFGEWDEKRRNEWWFAFYKTEEGRRYYERASTAVVKVQPDGSFRLDDVPEGHYRLDCDYETYPTGFNVDPQEGPTRVAELRLDLDIPAGPADTPMDLGTLTLTAPERGAVDR